MNYIVYYYLILLLSFNASRLVTIKININTIFVYRDNLAYLQTTDHMIHFYILTVVLMFSLPAFALILIIIH